MHNVLLLLQNSPRIFFAHQGADNSSERTVWRLFLPRTVLIHAMLQWLPAFARLSDLEALFQESSRPPGTRPSAFSSRKSSAPSWSVPTSCSATAERIRLIRVEWSHIRISSVWCESLTEYTSSLTCSGLRRYLRCLGKYFGTGKHIPP